jgi:hypothetical protein
MIYSGALSTPASAIKMADTLPFPAQLLEFLLTLEAEKIGYVKGYWCICYRYILSGPSLRFTEAVTLLSW